MCPPINNSVFISYAKEDIGPAEGIYTFLMQAGFDPWLDKKKLLPGQDWNLAIQEALHRADFIILLLSETSVSKRGYIQREFRKALEYCEYKLDSDIYIIPIKLNECDVPQQLQRFQWIEYTDQEMNKSVLRALRTQQKTLLESQITGSDINIIEEKLIQGEYGTQSPKQIYEIAYPKFTKPTGNDEKEINLLLECSVFESMLGVRGQYYDDLQYVKPTDVDDLIDLTDSTDYMRLEIKLYNVSMFSYTDFTSNYYTGAAHGMFGITGHNFLLNPLRKFKLIDLIQNHDKFIQKMRDLVHEKLMYKAKNEYEEDRSTSFYVYGKELEAKEENFDNYFFTKTELVMIYNPYEITSWADGMHLVNIEYYQMLSEFNFEEKLCQFIRNTFLNEV